MAVLYNLRTLAANPEMNIVSQFVALRIWLVSLQRINSTLRTTEIICNCFFKLTKPWFFPTKVAYMCWQKRRWNGVTYVENNVWVSVEEFAVLVFGPVGNLELLDNTVQRKTCEILRLTYHYSIDWLIDRPTCTTQWLAHQSRNNSRPKQTTKLAQLNQSINQSINQGLSK